MTPDELRREQNRITGPIVAVVLLLLRRLPVAALTPARLAALLVLLFPQVVRARSRSVALAKTYYASLNPDGTAPELPEQEYAQAMLGKALESYLDARVEDEESHEAAAVQGAAAVGRHVEQAGREYVALATNADNIRYARYDPYGETCAFCRMLISRGPVYLSQQSGAFQSHPNCTCVAVPVWDVNDWPGKEQADEAERLWIESTTGTFGKESIRAFRRAVEEKTG